MKSPVQAGVPTTAPLNKQDRLFAASFGSLLGLTLLKFGNPPIMEKWVNPPEGIYEFLLGSPWPIGWAYTLLGAVVLLGFFVSRWKTITALWLVCLPAAWLVWQVIASTQTVSPALTAQTLRHFVATTACFYLGLFGLARVRDLRPFWLCLLLPFLVVVAVGWTQRFGGLEETRRYFFLYIYPTLKEVSPEYLKKMNSTRIFSTVFYPNTLAGVVLLLLPSALVFVWSLKSWFTSGARSFLVACIALASLACLYWSGSKGGWLVMLLSGLVFLIQLPWNRRYKAAVVVLALVFGLAGFLVKFADFFQKGATSVGARFDYWRAAVKTVAVEPVLGTGPGTFAIAYERVRRPGSEPSRLVHNDYLEQASDSGIPGFALFTSFVLGTLALTVPRRTREGLRQLLSGSGSQPGPDSRPEAPVLQGIGNRKKVNRPQTVHDLDVEEMVRFAVWLGLLSWAVQSLSEFNLYIPALSWAAFTFAGWLVGTANRIDTQGESS